MLTLRLQRSFSDRQFRAGVDLISGAGLSAVAGLAFWFVAARSFDEHTVGVNATLISTMALIVNGASLGLKNGLIRYVPAYGLAARRLVIRAYAATLATTFVLAPTAAIVLSASVEELHQLGSAAGVVGFSAACLLWMVFVLQDSVLVAVGETRIIPVANGTHAAAKLGLLAILALSKPAWGIFIAFVLPTVFVVAEVNRRAFKRLGRDTRPTGSAPAVGLARFAAGEHVGLLLNMGLIGILPVLVLAQRGEESAAFYSVAWTIAYNLMLVSSSVSAALLAEASRTPAKLHGQAAKAMRQMAVFVVPGALVMALGAPLVLRIFGASYAAEASTLLRLLALTAIANIAVATAIGSLRASRQVGRLLMLHAVRTSIIAGLGISLLPRYGIVGLGVGWFVGETLMAVAVAVLLLRPVLTSATPAAVVRLAGRFRAWANSQLATYRLRPVVRTISHYLTIGGGEKKSARTPDYHVISASSDKAVLLLEPNSSRPLVLKTGWSKRSSLSIDREADQLVHLQQALKQDAEFDLFRATVPELIMRGQEGSHRWMTQSVLRGTPMLRQPVELAGLVAHAAKALTPLHERTKTITVADDELLGQIVDRPIATIAAARPDKSDALRHIARDLRRRLSRRELTISDIHGDFAPANVLFDPTSGQVTAIVDWELAQHRLPPEIDFGHFVIALVSDRLGVEHGQLLAAFFIGEETQLAPLLDAVSPYAPNCFEPATVLLLSWLHHVSSNLTKSDEYRMKSVWLAANIDNVLDAAVASATSASANVRDLAR